MGPDPAAGLPEHLGGGGHRGAVGARAAPSAGRDPRPGARARSSRMAALRWMPVTATTSIQELAFFGPGRLPIPLPLHRGILPKLARVTGPSWGGLVTVTFDGAPSVR